MSARPAKRKVTSDKDKTKSNTDNELDSLFVNAPPDVDSDADDGDSTDSEESVYSGLEEEEDSEEDEEDSEENSDAESEDSDDDAGDTNGINPTKSNNLKKSKSKDSGIDAGSTKATEDEYRDDSSDEEDIRNTVGNIPLEWYRDYEHIGYDIAGRKLIKPEKRDELDAFLNKMDNPEYWRTVTDKLTGQDVVLTKEDLETIQKLKKGKFPTDAAFNPHEEYVDFFTHETMIHPITNRPEDKRSFIPSKWEKLKVGQMVHAIKMGWMKPRKPKTDDDDDEEEDQKFYMLWDNEDQSDISKSVRPHMPAPKLALPGHEESYNPPPEYLMTEEEQLAWKEREPEERKLNFLPRKYSCLRQVPAYKRFINERFERCLDLYLCPRQQKMRMNVSPEDLLPKLPKPRDLQPFPTSEAVLYKGHKGLVRTISADPTGQWLVSGSDDCTLKFWEVATGRNMKTIKVDSPVKSVVWNENNALV